MKKYLKVFVFILLPSAIILIELFLRINYHEQLKIHAYPLIYEPDTLLGYRYTPNAWGEIDMPSITKKFKINNQGYYGNDFEVEKRKGTIRVIIAGSSVENGIWLNAKENFSIKLQNLFKERGYNNVEIVNCAIDGGYREITNINLIKSQLINYNPDIILLGIWCQFESIFYMRECYKGYVINYSKNPQSRELAIANVNRIEGHNIYFYFYRGSYLFRALTQEGMIRPPDNDSQLLSLYINKANKEFNSEWHRDKYTIEKSATILKQLQFLLKERNIKLILLDYYKNPVYQKVSNEYGLNLLQLGITFHEEHLHKLDEHFNELAHQLIADSLYHRLNQELAEASFGFPK